MMTDTNGALFPLSKNFLGTVKDPAWTVSSYLCGSPYFNFFVQMLFNGLRSWEFKILMIKVHLNTQTQVHGLSLIYLRHKKMGIFHCVHLCLALSLKRHVDAA